MAGFLPSAHAPKRAVAGFEEGRAPILRLNMVAGDVVATYRKHATRKPVKVRHFTFKHSFFVPSALVLVCFESALLVGLVKIMIAR